MNYERSRGGILMPVQQLQVGGIFTGQIVRDGQIIDEFDAPNLVVDQGLNHILDTVLHGSTQVGTWYLGVFEGNYTPVAALTAAAIAGAATECTAYGEATRPAYDEAGAAAKVVTNSASKATFTFNATKTLYGAFIISDNTKGGTTGTLLAASKFAAPKGVVSTDQLLLTYSFTAASA
jgi:hypothetical protein